MSCINPDGQPTESGLKMLKALQQGKGTPEEISSASGLPIFRVRSGIRDMVQAGYVIIENNRYQLTNKGVDLLGK